MSTAGGGFIGFWLVVMAVFAIVFIACSVWWNRYEGFFDWYYSEINKAPGAGDWYYKRHRNRR